MGLGWKDWKRSDIIYGVIVPIVVVLAIVGIYYTSAFLLRGAGGRGGSFGAVIGILTSLEEMVMIVGVPLVLGLVWNQWAGGSSGFLLGSIYSIWYAVEHNLFGATRGSFNLTPTLLGWVLSAMLIGYMSGVLNKHSFSFSRMLIAGLVATATGGIFLFGMFQLSPSNVMTGADGFLLTVLPRIGAAVLIAVIARVITWYGVFSHPT